MSAPKVLHEIRDPIHVFVRIDSDERKVLDSPFVQRLRHVHQLALTSMLYPGATHKRFEHSLGVMELAGRVYDVITDDHNVHEKVREVLPELSKERDVQDWRAVLRMAALCHDVGHLPFSHAAEKRLLPEGWDHERLTRAIIESQEMTALWKQMRLDPTSIVKLAVGQKKARDLHFSPWEAILSEVIVGDAFGVDRMDYLLRDSHNAGVAYGHFDHFRLVDTLRILPTGPQDEPIPVLGVEEGGLHSAEALLLARYFMYKQVYLHPIRLIYDIHLIEFLEKYLPGGKFSTDLTEHLNLTDNEVEVAILAAARNPQDKAHVLAKRLVDRSERFRWVYGRGAAQMKATPRMGDEIGEGLKKAFGPENVRVWSSIVATASANDFPVQRIADGSIESSLILSDVLPQLPPVAGEHFYVAPKFKNDAAKWITKNVKKDMPGKPVESGEKGK